MKEPAPTCHFKILRKDKIAPILKHKLWEVYRPKMVYIDKRTIKVKDDVLLSIYENYKKESPI